MGFTLYGHGGHLGNVTWIINNHFLKMIQNLALIGQVVSEEKMFEYYGNIHVYCPGWAGDQFFQNH